MSIGRNVGTDTTTKGITMPRKQQAFPKKQRGGQRKLDPQIIRKIVALRGSDPTLRRMTAVKRVIPEPPIANTHNRVCKEVKKYENLIVDWEKEDQHADRVVPVTNLDVARRAARLSHYDPVCHQDAPLGTLVLATQGTPKWEHCCKNGYHPWRQGRDERGNEWIMRKYTGRLLTSEEHEEQHAKYFAEIDRIFLDGSFPSTEEEPIGFSEVLPSRDGR